MFGKNSVAAENTSAWQTVLPVSLLFRDGLAFKKLGNQPYLYYMRGAKRAVNKGPKTACNLGAQFITAPSQGCDSRHYNKGVSKPTGFQYCGPNSYSLSEDDLPSAYLMLFWLYGIQSDHFKNAPHILGNYAI